MWSVGNPTKIITPVWASSVVVNFGIQWQSNSTGQRYMKINSSDSTNVGLPGRQSVPKFDLLGEITSNEINIAGGEEFWVTVFQDTGASLNIVQGNATYMSLRIIN
jgi:hypothetical protein